MLEVYKFFSIPETLRQVSMLAIPSTWPIPDIKSYAYDFSVVYAISANMRPLHNCNERAKDTAHGAQKAECTRST